MKLMKTAGLIAAAFGLVALMGGEAYAQAPTLTATLTGPRLDISWTAIPGVTGYVISAGTAPGSSNIATVPLPPTTTSVAINPIPAGTYYLRVRGALGATLGPNSNEVTVTVGATPPPPPPPPPGPCTPPTAPSATAAVVGPSVTLSWAAVEGATGYQVVFSRFPGGSELVESATGVTHTKIVPVLGTFFARVIANNACGAASSAEVTFTVSSLVNPNAPRTPNPPPGQLLPPPSYGESVVRQIASQYRGDLFNSCAEAGGNNIWLFRLLAALRQRDSRWGLNLKRGYQGLSQDIIAFNPTDRPDNNETQIYLFDTISGHCGGNPDWNWTNVTQGTWDAGAQGLCEPGNRHCARWTITPYLQAGFPAAEGQK